MEILVTGADGFVGTLLCSTLESAGYYVRRAVWNIQDHYDLSHNWVETGDIGPNTNWAIALKGIDVIIHLAGRVHMIHETFEESLSEYRRVNTAGTQQLARSAAEAQTKRIIFISTLHVNGEFLPDNKSFTEKSIPKPVSPYAISKWEAEQTLHKIASETGIEIVIVRPPLVYGPGVKGNFLRLMQLVYKGVPLPLGSIRNSRSFLSRTNLVDFLIHCIEHPDIAGETFLVSDKEDVSTTELIHKIAYHLQCRDLLLPFPVSLLQIGGKMIGKSKAVARLVGSLTVDPNKAFQLIDWQPPITMDEELAQTAQWFKENRGKINDY